MGINDHFLFAFGSSFFVGYCSRFLFVFEAQLLCTSLQGVCYFCVHIYQGFYNIVMKRIPKEEWSPGRIAWVRFRKDIWGMVALSLIMIVMLIAVLGSLITPDSTPFANRQMLELGTSKPGFQTQMIKIEGDIKNTDAGWFEKMIFGQKDSYTYIPLDAFYFSQDSIVIQTHRSDSIEDIDFLSFSLVDVLGLMPSSSRQAQQTIIKLQQKVVDEHIVKKKFILGTDQFGRDMLSRLMIGARVSLSVGFISVFISLVIGIVVGSLGGYFRGRVDDAVVWIINVVWSIPTLLLVIAITFALGKGFWQVFIAVGLTMWVEVARVVRGQMLGIREKEYAEAAKALGFGHLRIIFRHLLPNVMGPVIVISAANFASAILIEAGLSFLGLGVQPPMPSWGSMIKENYAFIILDAAFLAILPGLAIMLLVLSFMMVGNALRDALDIRQ